MLQLTLPLELEVRLRQEAERHGETAEAVALRLLNDHLPPPLDERRAAAIAMLHQWIKEDTPAGTVEEDEDFFRNLDASRPSHRSLFPQELKGITW